MKANFTSQWLAELETRRAQKRGHVAPVDDGVAGVARESDLHDEIEAHCRSKGWLAIHSRMDMPTTTAKGAPDFVIYASQGVMLHIECKTRVGKLTPEQAAFHAMAERLGHKVHVVRTIEQFFQVAACATTQ